MIETILQAVGIKKLPFFAGLIGAVISLKFVARQESVWQRFFMVCAGGLVANYVTPLVQLWLKTQEAEPGIAFALGLFGMSFAAALMEAVKPFVQGLLARVGGGGGQ